LTRNNHVMLVKPGIENSCTGIPRFARAVEILAAAPAFFLA
jgi:hypothetical protein